MVTPYVTWHGAIITKLVYCTARVDPADSPSGRIDQNAYIAALQDSQSVTFVEKGRYVSWGKTAPLTATKRSVARPKLYRVTGNEIIDPALPLTTRLDPIRGHDVVMATIRHREEKGSDVNVAAHLLHDVLTRKIDAAIVITNDSDLGLPLRMARNVVPIGLLSPYGGYIAGSLQGTVSDGVGGHWWRKLTPPDFLNNQLPAAVGSWRKPTDW